MQRPQKDKPREREGGESEEKKQAAMRHVRRKKGGGGASQLKLQKWSAFTIEREWQRMGNEGGRGKKRT